MAMTNTERIEANNAELRELIEAAEALPDAGGMSFTVDETLSFENGVLSVNTTDEPVRDDIRPITSGAVYDEFEKAVALLKTI